MAFLQKVYPISFNSSTTGLSVTSSMEIPGSWLYVYLQVPTMSVGYSAASTQIYVQSSPDNGVNFPFVRYTNSDFTGTSLAGTTDFTIASSVSQRVMLIPNFAMRYVKLEISGTVTAPTSQSGPGFAFIVISNQ